MTDQKSPARAIRVVTSGLRDDVHYDETVGINAGQKFEEIIIVIYLQSTNTELDPYIIYYNVQKTVP